MATIDERIVSMVFSNAKFEAGVAQTMASLSKLDASLAKVGSHNGLADIEKSANKVTLEQPMSALDKLKARFSRAGEGAAEGMGQIEKAGNKVSLDQPIQALDKVQAKTGQVGEGAAEGFGAISKAANRIDVSGAHSALDSIQAKFSVLEGAAAVAFGNIASKIALSATDSAKKFTVGPVQQGLEEYQTNLKSIQTIKANTEQAGVGLPAINKALKELNLYSDETIYNFAQMAQNIGRFTAAGVDLEKATASIKGIANLAALGGAGAEETANVMKQLSQAIAAGKVGAQDWNSVTNAGIGGVRFQTALVRTAKNMNQLDDGQVKVLDTMGNLQINEQSFRESIMSRPGQKSWLTSGVLTETLQQMTGDMTAAQLASKGYTDQEAKDILAMAKTAKKAATESKTLSQVLDVAQEGLASGWAETWQNIYGDFDQAKKTFTALGNALTGFIGKNSEARNKVLLAWNKGGGRAMVIEGIKNAFKALFAILKPIAAAFRDIFPKKSADDLIRMSKTFRDFTAGLKIGPETAENLKRTFRGFFAILSIGKTIIGGIIGVFADLIGTAGKGSGGILNFTGSIGDFFVSIDKALKKGNGLTSFFAKVTEVGKTLIKFLRILGGAVADIFTGGDSNAKEKFNSAFDDAEKKIKPLAAAMDKVKIAAGKMTDAFKKVKDKVAPIFEKIGETVKNVALLITDAFNAENFNKVLAAVQTTFVAGLFFAIKKGISGLFNLDFGGTSALGNLNKSLDALTGSLKAMQQSIQAGTLVKIAIAIGILAAAIFLISTIEPKKLATAMSAVAVGLGELIGAMVLLSKVGGATAFLTLPILATGLIALAIAVGLLALAVKAFSTLSWEELVKGLAGVAGVLVAVGLGLAAMGTISFATSQNLLAIAFAVKTLAAAVFAFSQLSWKEMAKGLVGVAGALIAVGIGTKFVGPGLFVMGPSLIGIAFALHLLAGAVRSFGEIPLKALATGIVGIAASLVVIGLALVAMPPNMIVQAAGLVVLSVALVGIAGAVKLMGSMDLGTLAKGLAGIAGALVVLGYGLTFMAGTLPGSIALVAAAAGLMLLVPVIAALGNMDWGTIFKGLGAIALTMGTIAIAGLLAAPAILALGIALGVLGLAVILISSGLYIVAAGLALLGSEGTKGIAVMVAALTAFVTLLPTLIITFVTGLLRIVAEVAKLAPKVVGSLVKIIDSILNVVIQSAPKLAIAIGTLITSILYVIGANAPKIVAAGFKLLSDFLRGIDSNIGQVIPRVGSIITKFLNGLATEAPRIIAAGARLVVAFLNGIAVNMVKVGQAALRVGVTFLNGIARGAPQMVAAGARAVASFLRAISEAIPRVMAAGVRIILSFLTGLGNSIPKVVNKGVEIAGKFVRAVANGMVRLAAVGADAVIRFLNGLADVIRTKGPELRRAGWNLADAILDGLVAGFKELGSKAINAVKDVIGALPKAARKILGIKSPSKVFQDIGRYMVEGMDLGLRGVPGALAARVEIPLRNMLRETYGVREFGKYLGAEFQQGLTGGLFGNGKSQAQEQIEGSFNGLRDKLQEAQGKLEEQVKSGQDKLTELLNADPKSQKEIIANQKEGNKVYAELTRDKLLLAEASKATSSFTKSLRDEKGALILLATEYEGVTSALEKAKTALDEISRTRDEAIKSYSDQYSQLPNMGSLLDQALAEASLTAKEKAEAAKKKREEDEKRSQIDQVALYKQALQKQINDTKKYMETLASLRAAGLDDVTYKSLLSQGTAGQEFASQLLRGGKDGIEQLNKMNEGLAKAAAELAQKAANDLYQAGVKAAEGLVQGLTDRQAQIRQVMENIASTMVQSIKRQLGIRSPSSVFAEIGKFAAQGVALGLTATSGAVSSAAATIGDEAAVALSNSLANISDRVGDNIDTDLTITPVLDLTQVQKDASKMQDLTNVTPITAAVSYGQATAISEDKAISEEAQAALAAQAAPTFNYVQNNNSPESLSSVEIYRQTKNQLSQVKSALGLAS